MKRILFVSLIALAAFSCGNNPKKGAKGTAPADAVAALAEEAPESPVMSLFESAPVSLTEDIIRQLPPELLPEPNNEGQDGVTQMVAASAGNAPGHVDWNEFFGECDVVGINTHAFPRTDGSWLFTYVDGAGCDCYVQGEPRAFNYAGGKLTPCPWPFEQPRYEDFVNPLVEGLVDADELAWIKDDWSIHYAFGVESPSMLRAYFQNIDYYNFTSGCRYIDYEWDGSSFDRKDGRYGLIRTNGFGQFSPYGYVENIPEGFSVKGKGSHQSLVDDTTGETIALFTIDADEAIMAIEVLSPEYENEEHMFPGMPLADIDAQWEGYEFQKSDASIRANGDVVINFLNYNLVVDAKDIEGEPEGPEDKLKVWSYKPYARLKSILVE